MIPGSSPGGEAIKVILNQGFWPLPESMIKLVYCPRKRDDIYPDSFYRYWLEEHRPAVKSVAEAIGASRYVQSHTILPELNKLMIESRGL